MMGVGKSTIGGLLAARTGRTHIDTDRTLVQKLGRPIPQLFQIFGETTFRDHETAVLKSLEPGPLVVSTGGGIVLRPQNWIEMRRLGVTIFLDVPLEILADRLAVSKKRRPLLEGEDRDSRIAAILEQRLPLYRQADITVTLGSGTAEDGANLVLDALEVAL